MDRRDFLKMCGAGSLAACMGAGTAGGYVAAHNWDKYDFGSGPAVKDRWLCPLLHRLKWCRTSGWGW
jgi:anaerobic selenocysteine-containing dehydrogenase